MCETILHALSDLLADHDMQTAGNGLIRFVKSESSTEFGHFKFSDQRLLVVIYDQLGPCREYTIDLCDPTMADRLVALMSLARLTYQDRKPLNVRGY